MLVRILLALALLCGAAQAQVTNSGPVSLKTCSLTTTHDISVTGTQAITGCGFSPTSCTFRAAINSAAGGSWGDSDSAKTSRSIGISTDTTAMAVVNVAVVYSNAAGSTQATATVTSYDADGLTITWAKNGSPSGTLTVQLLCRR